MKKDCGRSRQERRKLTDLPSMLSGSGGRGLHHKPRYWKEVSVKMGRDVETFLCRPFHGCGLRHEEQQCRLHLGSRFGVKGMVSSVQVNVSIEIDANSYGKNDQCEQRCE